MQQINFTGLHIAKIGLRGDNLANLSEIFKTQKTAQKAQDVFEIINRKCADNSVILSTEKINKKRSPLVKFRFYLNTKDEANLIKQYSIKIQKKSNNELIQFFKDKKIVSALNKMEKNFPFLPKKEIAENTTKNTPFQTILSLFDNYS